jgi:hypothetical protein
VRFLDPDSGLEIAQDPHIRTRRPVVLACVALLSAAAAAGAIGVLAGQPPRRPRGGLEADRSLRPAAPRPRRPRHASAARRRPPARRTAPPATRLVSAAEQMPVAEAVPATQACASEAEFGFETCPG